MISANLHGCIVSLVNSALNFWISSPMMKRQFNTSLKVLRTDGGGKYNSHKFYAFPSSSSERIRPVPILHPKNGAASAGRKHGHLIKTTIALMYQSSVLFP